MHKVIKESNMELRVIVASRLSLLGYISINAANKVIEGRAMTLWEYINCK